MLSVIVKISFAILCLSHVSVALWFRLHIIEDNKIQALDVTDADREADSVIRDLKQLSRNRPIAVILADGPVINDVNVLEYLRELDASDASKGVLCVVAVFFEGNPDSKGKTPVELSQALAIQDLEDFVIVCMELEEMTGKSALYVPKHVADKLPETTNDVPAVLGQFSNNLKNASFGELIPVRSNELGPYVLRPKKR